MHIEPDPVRIMADRHFAQIKPRCVKRFVDATVVAELF
jgi:hypothetical protein